MKYLISSLFVIIIDLVFAQVSLNINAIPRKVEVLLDGSAPWPNITSEPPVVTVPPASAPTKTLYLPVVAASPAL